MLLPPFPAVFRPFYHKRIQSANNPKYICNNQWVHSRSPATVTLNPVHKKTRRLSGNVIQIRMTERELELK